MTGLLSIIMMEDIDRCYSL